MTTQYRVLSKREDAHGDAIWAAAWGKGGDSIVTGSLDDTVKVWTWSDHDHHQRRRGRRTRERLELRRTLRGHQLGVVSVDVSPDGRRAASSSLDGRLRLWDIPGEAQEFSGDSGEM